MPRIHVSKPTQAQVAAHPREFALLAQCKPDAEHGVDAQALAEYQKLYGSDKPVHGPALSFEEFVALFAQPATTPLEGDGNAVGYAARDPSGHLAPFTFTRRPVGEHDVCIQIAYAGICNSDLKTAHAAWGPTTFPVVTGHEIGGIVTEEGARVSKFKVGDRAAVGCMVNSCGSCHWCAEKKEEQYCDKGATYTYNATDKDGTPTYGGYSTHIVVTESFVLHLPDNLPMDAATPLLCAGITCYSPIKHFGLDKPGLKVAVVGLGGLGHMAVKFLKAFGVHVTVISRSYAKQKEAQELLGVDSFIASSDEAAIKAHYNTFDGVFNTVSAKMEVAMLLKLLKVDGKLVTVGVPEATAQPPLPSSFILRRQTIAGSLIGGIQETQEMLDFCSQHNIVCIIEKIPIQYVNEAWKRLDAGDVRYRFVIDIQGSLIK